MKWLGRRQSGNVEDRRFGGGGMIAGGGIIGLIVYLISVFMGGGENLPVNDQRGASTSAYETGTTAAAPNDEMAQFISVALADNEDVWKKLFAENNLQYREPKLVLFSDATFSGCGNAQAAVGPFYCPADEKIYIDLTFFNELKNRFGASGGDFAAAYVLAHEVGHHVQHLLGTADNVRGEQSRLSKKEANRLSVALELQADFYAGIWAHYNQKMNNVLEEGDIDEAMSAASAVGDDAIQKKTQGRVVPDAFTHGTSEQRKYWFMLGYKTGDLNKGNTFAEL